MEGQRLGHYEIRRPLGQGGMGVVYEASDLSLGRRAAIKVLHADKAQDPARRRRFLREAKAASALNHPNIVTVYEVGTESDSDFIAMELIDGEPLTLKMRGGPVPLADALRYALQIAEALACAHAAGLVHRDLKPANAMVARSGLVKLLDFGLAKQHSPEAASLETSPLTQEGSVIGTLAYMSPEQARGEATGPASDIFAFGILLYEMLTGRRPFAGNSQVELFHEILYATPPPIPREAGVPPAISAAIFKALEKDPAERIESMNAFASLLREEAVRSGKTARERSLSRRGAAVAGIGAAALTGAGWWFAPWLQDAGERFRSRSDLPVSASEHVRRGHAFFDRRDRKADLQQAKAHFEAAVRSDPQNAAAWAGLADTELATHLESPDPMLLSRAAQNAGRALKLNPHLAAAHASVGWHQAHTGKPAEGLASLRRALELDPKNAHIRLRAASTLLRMRRFDECEGEIRRALADAPDHWEPYSHQGTFLYVRGRYLEAERALQKGCSIAPDHYVMQRTLGAVEFALQRFDDARGAFQRSLEARPTASALSNLGTVEYYTFRYDQSVDAFRRALEIDANNFVVWANLGDAYAAAVGTHDKAMGSWTQAIRLARAQLERTPENVALRCHIASLLAKTGDHGGSRSMLAAIGAEQISEPDPLFHRVLAWVAMGDRVRALADLEAALKGGLPAFRVRNEPQLLELRRAPGYHLLEARVAAFRQ